MSSLVQSSDTDRSGTDTYYPPAELISEIDFDDLPITSTNVSFCKARKGYNIIQDTSLAFGLPTYVTRANGINGNAAVRCDRNIFPRLMFEVPLWPTPEYWIFEFIHNPTTAVAIATTRGYLFGATSTFPLTVEGTRLILPQNANSDGLFNKNGWFTDEDLPVEANPLTGALLNPGWHEFWTPQLVSPLVTIGWQISTWVLSENPFWMRNGVLMGRGLYNSYTNFKRAMSVKTVLFSGHNEDLTSTTGYYDGDVTRFRCWLGQETERQVSYRHAVANTRYKLF